MYLDISDIESRLLPNGITEQLEVHVSLQLCDTKSFQNQPRICGNDRTLLSKKSLRSFFDTIKQCNQERPATRFSVLLLWDEISDDLHDFMTSTQNEFRSSCLEITTRSLYPEKGISDSIRGCYQWMQDHGRHIVGQFQDDYIFRKDAFTDCVDIILQIQHCNKSDPIITPHHCAKFWREIYENKSTPRYVTVGAKDYWIQLYDIACTFFTTHWQFSQHWDLYNLFFELCKVHPMDGMGLESSSLNHMMCHRAVLAMQPIRTLSHHMQTTEDIDPHQDWRILWDTIEID